MRSNIAHRANRIWCIITAAVYQTRSRITADKVLSCISLLRIAETIDRHTDFRKNNRMKGSLKVVHWLVTPFINYGMTYCIPRQIDCDRRPELLLDSSQCHKHFHTSLRCKFQKLPHNVLSNQQKSYWSSLAVLPQRNTRVQEVQWALASKMNIII